MEFEKKAKIMEFPKTYMEKSWKKLVQISFALIMENWRKSPGKSWKNHGI